MMRRRSREAQYGYVGSATGSTRDTHDCLRGFVTGCRDSRSCVAVVNPAGVAHAFWIQGGKYFRRTVVMIDTKHTRGPWKVGKELANARLIAAAPDLLEALTSLERISGIAAPHDDPARVAARAAIAKATHQ